MEGGGHGPSGLHDFAINDSAKIPAWEGKIMGAEEEWKVSIVILLKNPCGQKLTVKNTTKRPRTLNKNRL